jgi:hypothetical protein
VQGLFQEKLLKIHATCKAEFRSWKLQISFSDTEILFHSSDHNKDRRAQHPQKKKQKKAFYFSDPPPPQPSPIWTSLEKLINQFPGHKWTQHPLHKNKK